MHVSVDETRHEHPPVQIDDLCCGTGENLSTGAAADVRNTATTDGQGLLHAVLVVDGVYVAIQVDGVGRRRGGRCGCLSMTRCDHAQQESEIGQTTSQTGLLHYRTPCRLSCYLPDPTRVINRQK